MRSTLSQERFSLLEPLERVADFPHDALRMVKQDLAVGGDGELVVLAGEQLAVEFLL